MGIKNSKRIPFHIKHNLKPYEYEGKKFYAKNQEEADLYIERLKMIKNNKPGIT
jgi:hypothetical protein